MYCLVFRVNHYIGTSFYDSLLAQLDSEKTQNVTLPEHTVKNIYMICQISINTFNDVIITTGTLNNCILNISGDFNFLNIEEGKIIES